MEKRKDELKSIDEFSIEVASELVSQTPGQKLARWAGDRSKCNDESISSSSH